jgi:Cu(I)/Ag(I) efflux system periplasmic protein CusF
MIRLAFLLAAAVLASAPALAQHHRVADMAKSPTPGKEPSQGEVRKVDKDAGKITLKHGPIPNLEMPPMTMVFKVKDAAMLDKVKAGDAVRFRAENVAGAYVVTDLQPAK